MKYARPNRHYRAAQKQTQQQIQQKRELRGTFISRKDKPKIAAMSAGVVLLSFLLGFFIGAALDIED